MVDDSGAPKQPFESRVEDLFSSAVEQQAAERRALGSAMREISELVASLQGDLSSISQRLDTLEVRVGQDGRGIREAATAIQDGLDVTVSRLTSAVTDQLEAAHRRDEEARNALQRAVLAGLSEARTPDVAEVDTSRRLERIETSLADLTARLADRDLPTPTQIGEAVASLLPPAPSAEEIGRAVAGSVRVPSPPDADAVARAVAAAVPTPHVPTADDIAAVVVGALPAPPAAADADEIARTVVAALPAPAEFDADEVARAVAAVLPTPVGADEVARAVAAVLPEPVDADEVAGSVLAGLPQPEPRLDVDALADRLALAQPAPEPLDLGLLAARLAAAIPPAPSPEAIAAAVTDVVGERLDPHELAEGVAARLPAPPDQPNVAAEVVEALRGQQDELTTTLVRELQLRLDLVADEVHDAVDGAAAGIRAGLSGVRDDADQAARRHAEAVATQTEAEVRRAVTDLVGPVLTSLDGLKDELTQPWAMLDRLAVRLDAVVQAVSGLDDVAGRLEDRTELEELRQAVRDLGDRVERPLALLDEIGVGVASAQSRLEVLGGVEEAVSRLGERVGRLDDVERTVAGLQESLAGPIGLTASLSAVRQDLARLDEMAASTDHSRQQLDRIAALVGALRDDEGDLRGLPALGERLSVIESRLADSTDDAADRIDEAMRSAQSALDRTMQAVSARQQELAGELLQRFDARIRELLDASRDAEEMLEERLAAAARTLESAAGQQASSMDRLLDELGATDARLAQLDGGLTEVRTGVGQVRSALGGQADTLGAMAGDVANLGVTIGRLIGELQASVLEDQERIAAQVRGLLVEAVGRVDAAGDRVATAAAKAAADLDDAATESAAAFDEATRAAADRWERSSEKGSERVTQVASAAANVLRESAGDVVSRLDDATGAVLDSASTLSERLVAMIADVTDDAQERTTDAARRLEDSVARLDGVYDAVAGFEPALVDYLIERDRQLDQQRVLLLRDLVEQLGGALNRRERKRLAGKLQPPSAPTPDGPAVPASRLPRRESAPPVKPSRVPTEPSPDEAPSAGSSAAEEDADRAPPPRRQIVARPRAAASPKPRRSRTVDREALLAIKGLGPARVDALIDAFGSAEAVASASAADLAEVDGISDALAQAIRDQFAAVDPD